MFQWNSYREATAGYSLVNVDAGKRLLESKSKYKELNGVAATAYLEKAEALFKEMDLEWDLEQLERVRTDLT